MVYVADVAREIVPYLRPGSVSPPDGAEPMMGVEEVMCEVAFSGVVIPRQLKAMFLDGFEPYYYQVLSLDEDGGEFFLGPDTPEYFPKFVAMEPVIEGRQVRYTGKEPLNEPYPD